jgi:metallo-beta-lactamase family protein
MQTTTLSFLGAAGNVTGSCYLVETSEHRILVDCGIYQERDLKGRNWQPFPVAPSSIDAVLLTHAHLDHCGLLPKLVREGFRGPIFCTPATAELAGIVMLDSGHIQEEDAAYKLKRHQREGRKGPHPVVPLYTQNDAQAVLPLFKPVRFRQTKELFKELRATFYCAGHILGASSIRLETPAGSILFSGDVGRRDMPILKDPAPPAQADFVQIESTYGNRIHDDNHDIPGELAATINKTHERGGHVIIPSFSIERAQDLIFHLNDLKQEGRIPDMPVFLDSPMAINVTDVFRKHPELYDEESTQMIRDGHAPCKMPRLSMTRTTEESKAIAQVREPAIIIAGSGMCTGGRIKHHLAHNISRQEATILFVGYQAVGTLGRLLVDGLDPVRILGQQYPVRAEICQLHGFSGHADQNELLQWIDMLEHPPRHVFITHGEPDASKHLTKMMQNQYDGPITIPAYQSKTVLS